MEKYCRIYVVRHGQAQSNVDKIVAGVTDSPLTEEGAKQAEERKFDFSGIKFDAVFSSDLIRAKRTAEIISAERQLAVNTTKLLREVNFGDWEGRKESEVLIENQDLFDKLKTLSDKEKDEFKFNPGYENDNEVSARFITFIREIAVAFLGKQVLVGTHGSIMRAFLKHIGFGTYDELPAGCIINTGYFIL